MTEYTSNSEAIREYMSARERTAQWIHAHSPTGTVPTFMTPSYPPSMNSDSDAPSYGPSDSDESSHSLPPRMVLRYNDGRPDIPIATDYNPHSGTYSRPAPKMRSAEPRATPTHRRSKSGPYAQPAQHGPSHVPSRHAQSLSYASQPVVEPRAMPEPPRSPESIVILPSRESSQNTQSTSQTAHSQPPVNAPQPRYPSSTYDAALQVPLPPSTISQIPQQHSRFGTASRHSSHPSQHGIVSPSPRRAFDPSQIPLPASSPPISHSHSQPLPAPAPRAATSFAPHPPSTRVQSQLPYTYSPPAIIYAPSSKHSRSHYAPPAIVYSPSATHHAPSRHAPSMTYSHSAPLPQGAPHQRAGSSVYHSAQGSMRSRRPGTTIPEEEPRMAGRYDRSVERDRGRSRSRGRSVPRTRTPAESVMYINDHELPPGAPRAQTPSDSFDDEDDRRTQASGSTYYVLPTPGQKVRLIVPDSRSIYTATSTTKSGHSPQSAHSGPKKAFFQRIFSIPKLSGSSSSSDGPGKRISRRHTIGGAHMQGRMGLPPR
ncbi:uncharacterized protein C8Q71DRAFT_797073 [Rhodofomes roseus]|uniref:Uncharacterized protein n=1 Tax=Rhodofomes roseus TaxID=34475 RepID=A0ABQ8KEY2_9APHY|nr:uncharacterized protein C8Q71DRAFT_797073 [Rhodofomes roseus]KAH9836276.1 hypothetical protein C8Q71DRAFT_797073 [Rhodofomes roseus]